MSIVFFLRRPSTYLIPAIFISCGVTFVTYELPSGYRAGLVLLIAAAGGIVCLDLLVGPKLPWSERFRHYRYAGTRDAFLAMVLAAAVTVFCIADLVLFPIPLFSDPASYATLSPLRAHVRHISNMCWILPPIALLCVRHRGLRAAMVTLGFVFPIVVIDRNRIFAGLFSFVLVMLLRRDPARRLPWKTIGLLVLAGGGVFSILGALRSGSLATVALPFSAFYRAMPQGVQWLLLYISAGPYNFGAMLAKGYLNASFLINQLVPFSGSISTAGTSIPLDAPNINVGTEFFPFLMAWGAAGALLAMLALYAGLVWSVRRLNGSLSIFHVLIFLRMAYACLMSPFAPQAFTWTNFGFIALCLVLHACTVLLPNRLSAHPSAA
ncbi:membrane protein [Xanthomonas euvesicatoria]|nr:membrane protein [Xanthomonas euvesicatoria]